MRRKHHLMLFRSFCPVLERNGQLTKKHRPDQFGLFYDWVDFLGVGHPPKSQGAKELALNIKMNKRLWLMFWQVEFFSGWKPTHLASIFYLGRTFLSLPHGTTLTSFADVKYGCCRMLDGLVSTHPWFLKLTLSPVTAGQCYSPHCLVGWWPWLCQTSGAAELLPGLCLKQKMWKFYGKNGLMWKNSGKVWLASNVKLHGCWNESFVVKW